MAAISQSRNTHEVPLSKEEGGAPDGLYPRDGDGHAGGAYTLDERWQVNETKSGAELANEHVAGGDLSPSELLMAGAGAEAVEAAEAEERGETPWSEDARIEAKRQEAARDTHYRKANEKPGTPEADYHLHEADRHATAYRAYDARAHSPYPLPVTPQPEMPEQTPNDLARPVPMSNRAQAAAEGRPMPRPRPGGDGSVPGGADEMFAVSQNYTEEMAGGYVAEAPTGNNPYIETGSLPIGSAGGIHNAAEATPYAAEHAHEAMEREAHHARLQARGNANMARTRKEAAFGRVERRRAKGLPTEGAQRDAGWAEQMELRARGVEELNREIEDGQLWREREDIGAERQLEAQRTGRKSRDARVKDAQAVNEDAQEGQERRNRAIEAQTERGEDQQNDQKEMSPIDLAERGVVESITEQPTEPREETVPAIAAMQSTASAGAAMSLPPHVEVSRSEAGTTYMFIVPENARGLGFGGRILLGVDDGKGNAGPAISEKAWALASEIQAAILRRGQSPRRDPDASITAVEKTWIPVQTAMEMLDSVPNNPETLQQEFRRKEDEIYERRRDEAAHEQLKPEDPYEEEKRKPETYVNPEYMDSLDEIQRVNQEREAKAIQEQADRLDEPEPPAP